MAKTIVGLFDDLSTAQDAVRDLQDNGFNRTDISLMARDQRRDAAYGAGAQREGSDAGAGAAAGAGTGAVLGGLAGLVVGLTALAIPGIGPIVAAGPLVTTLAGAGAGAVAGGIVGALAGAGVPEEEAHAYAEGVRRGGMLVMVRASDDMAGRARDIIRRYNPVDIHSRSEYWRQRNWQGFNDEGQPFTDEETTHERDYWRSNAPMGAGMAGGRPAEPAQTGYRAARYDETAGMGTTGTDYSTRAPRSDETSGTSTTGERYDETTGAGTGMSSAGGMRAGETFDRGSTGESFDTGTTGSDYASGGTGYRAGSAPARRGFSGMRRDFNDYSADFRGDFNTTYRAGGRDFSFYEPAYRYGYDLAGSERFQGRQWNEFEAEARNNWEQTHPNNPWDDVKDAVRHAWQRVTGD